MVGIFKKAFFIHLLPSECQGAVISLQIYTLVKNKEMENFKFFIGSYFVLV